MTTAEALEVVDRDGKSFANVNPHWWIGRSTNGYWCDYSYCDDPDCDCYQHDEDLSREEILKQFPNDEWLECI